MEIDGEIGDLAPRIPNVSDQLQSGFSLGEMSSDIHLIESDDPALCDLQVPPVRWAATGKDPFTVSCNS
jgi:hypothetical protein